MYNNYKLWGDLQGNIECMHRWLSIQRCLPKVVNGEVCPPVAVIFLVERPHNLPKSPHGARDVLTSNQYRAEDVAFWDLEVETIGVAIIG